MQDWNWAAIVAAMLGVVGTIGAQATLLRGEPGKLKTLRLLNQVLNEYGEGDGREELIDARAAFARRVSAGYLAPGRWSRFLESGFNRALVSFFAGYAVFAIAIVALAGPEQFPKIWSSFLPAGQLSLIVLSALALLVMVTSLVRATVDVYRNDANQRLRKRLGIRRRAKRVARLPV